MLLCLGLGQLRQLLQSTGRTPGGHELETAGVPTGIVTASYPQGIACQKFRPGFFDSGNRGSIVELACIGQGYLPTIIFVLGLNVPLNPASAF